MGLELHLIGVDHTDPRGYDRLRKILKHISPQAIALEYDADDVEGVEEFYAEPLEWRKDALRCPGADERTLEFYAANVWFEYLASKSIGVPLHLVDTAPSSAESQGNAKRSFDDVLCSTLEQISKIAEAEYRDPELTYRAWWTDTLVETFKRRDDVMEENVRKLDGVIAFPVGYGHMLWPYDNLASRFSDMRPKIWILPDIDNL